ncbi:MAG: S-layer homology domain-containing protein [Oscillospiraceae bacterium]|nr:S-layer homology domain-containing protein [Oscillospiraceae bacterium]
MKRMVSLLLILCLLPLAGLPYPVSGQTDTSGAPFADIPDAETRQAAELLHRLGVVSGTGGSSFSPGQPFDRAMLAVIATKLTGTFDVSTHGGTVRFPDVRATHWAHRWINAATTPRADNPPVMVGGADGLFHPEGPMLYGQLVTVLLKLLGYSDEHVGLNWPHSYIAQAEALGLSEGMSFAADQPLMRGEAARIIYNFMFSEYRTGGVYIEDPGTFSVTRETSLFQGKMSVRLIDRNGNVLISAPDDTVTYSAAVVAGARANGLDLADGSFLPVSSSVDVWDWDDKVSKYAPSLGFLENEPVTLVRRGTVLLCILRDSEEHKIGAQHAQILLRIQSFNGRLFVVDEDENTYRITGAIDASLVGRTGRLTFDRNENALSFVPSGDFTYRTVTVKEALPNGVADENGVIPLRANMPVHYSQGGRTTYEDFYKQEEIRPGDAFLLASNQSGRIEYIFQLTARVVGDNYRLAVLEERPAAGSDPLADAFGRAAADAVLYKNGFPATLDMLERWDVLMFYESAGVVEASSLRLSGFFSGPSPSPITPSSLMLFGQRYDLLPEATAKMSDFSSGLRWLFLLTHDGRIADVRSVGQASNTPIGLATSAGVRVSAASDELYAGTLSGLHYGRLGRFQGMTDERIQFTPFTLQKGGFGELNLANRTLGAVPLAPWCAFYEQVGMNGRAVRVWASDFPVARIPADKVLYAEIGPSGYATAIVLDNVGGDSYLYGFVAYDERLESSELGGSYVVSEIGVSPGRSVTDGYQWFLSGGFTPPRDGTVVGVAATNALSGDGTGVVSDIVTCVRYAGLARAAFNGVRSVRIGNVDVPIASSVTQVYIPSLPAGSERLMDLANARVYCRTFDVYTDPDGYKVRLIVGYP